MNLQHKLQIETRTAKITIMGLGYVGLPLAVAFAKAGFTVTGYDPSEKKVATINAGISDISDVPSATVNELVTTQQLTATTDVITIKQADIIIICVPTPLTASFEPDMRFIESAMSAISANLKEGALIVLESTTYPGTTREVISQGLEKQGLRLDTDFFAAYSPERVDPGNKRFTVQNTPKVVGGITEASKEYAVNVYNQIINQVVPVSTTEIAEMSKLLENTFRSVNIAFINEMAMLAEKLDINIWETIDAAATKPFGFMKFTPGPGIGGHCIPLDPMYLSWKAKSSNFFSRFIELSQDVNKSMPEHVVRKAMMALNKVGKSLTASKILLVGMAYKENISDLRESPALDIHELLTKQRASVDFLDTRATSFIDHEKETQQSIPLDYDRVAEYDLVVLLTCHEDMDVTKIATNATAILDTKNFLGRTFADKTTALGFDDNL